MVRKIWRHGCLMLSKVEQLEAENSRLKRMYAELQLDHDVPYKGVMTKKW